MKKKKNVNPRPGDLKVASYVFAYTKAHGSNPEDKDNRIIPTPHEVAVEFRFTKQAVWHYFNRLVDMGVLKKIGHGEYGIKPIAQMSPMFQELYKSSGGWKAKKQNRGKEK